MILYTEGGENVSSDLVVYPTTDVCLHHAIHIELVLYLTLLYDCAIDSSCPGSNSSSFCSLFPPLVLLAVILNNQSLILLGYCLTMGGPTN